MRPARSQTIPLLADGHVAISFMFLAAEAIVHCSPRGRIAGTEAWTARFRRTNLMVLVAAVWVVHARICARHRTADWRW
jgi:hypothetical protein